MSRLIAVMNEVAVCLLQEGSGIPQNKLVSVARLKVSITDVNDKAPQFVGLDVNGLYPAAVSDYTQRGDEVIFVSAIDLDTTSRNNEVRVGCLCVYYATIHSFFDLYENEKKLLRTFLLTK